MGSSSVTLRSSSFKEGYGFGLRVLGEEVYVGSGVDWKGIWVEYHLKGSNVGNSRGFLENDSLTSCKGGLFWRLVLFLVLRLLAINKFTKKC